MEQIDLMAQLPELYRFLPFAELQRVLGLAVARLRQDVEFTMAQLWPQTASGWGLELWETAYGIPVEPDKTDAARRTRVLSKLRGQGTPTAELIRSVVLAFVDGTVEIVEDHGAYSFLIRIVPDSGLPPDVDAIRAAVNEIKPAHLGMALLVLLMLRREHRLYTGFAVRLGRSLTVDCEIPPALDVTYFVDEDGALLADEAGNRIIDEEE